MHVPTTTLIGLVLAVLPIAAIAAIVWVTRLASRPIRTVPMRNHLVQTYGTEDARPVRRDHIV